MPGAGGGGPATHARDVLLPAGEAAPRGPPAASPVSPALPRAAILCHPVLKGGGKLHSDVERQGQLATIVV